MKINKAILTETIRVFGQESQINMIQEEAQELSLAVTKFKRAKKFGTDEEIEKARAKVVEELADNFIMLEQGKVLFDADEIQKVIDFKMNRLSLRIQKQDYEYQPQEA